MQFRHTIVELFRLEVEIPSAGAADALDPCEEASSAMRDKPPHGTYRPKERGTRHEGHVRHTARSPPPRNNTLA